VIYKFIFKLSIIARCALRALILSDLPCKLEYAPGPLVGNFDVAIHFAAILSILSS
jgi:hypothetical protein